MGIGCSDRPGLDPGGRQHFFSPGRDCGLKHIGSHFFYVVLNKMNQRYNIIALLFVVLVLHSTASAALEVKLGTSCVLSGPRMSTLITKQTDISLFFVILYRCSICTAVSDFFFRACGADFGTEMSQGLLAGFQEANDLGTLPGITFNLTVLDDVYDPQKAKNNTFVSFPVVEC